MADILWDIYQQSQIHKLQASAGSTAGRARQMAELVAGLENRIDRLALVCRALWSLLQETSQLSEDDLFERVKEIDLTDGRLDGKVAKVGSQCRQCGRVMSARHNKCLYCGAEALVETVFDQV